MRFGIRMLGITTILFGVYGTALKDAHPQSAADSRATPLILEKNEAHTRDRPYQAFRNFNVRSTSKNA